MLLVSPALEFHPTTETILQFFSRAVEIERVGVGANWRERPQVMFRLRGADKPLGQKYNLTATCISRGPRVPAYESITPKFDAPYVIWGVANVGVLVTLNASSRNWK